MFSVFSIGSEFHITTRGYAKPASEASVILDNVLGYTKFCASKIWTKAESHSRIALVRRVLTKPKPNSQREFAYDAGDFAAIVFFVRRNKQDIRYEMNILTIVAGKKFFEFSKQ